MTRTQILAKLVKIVAIPAYFHTFSQESSPKRTPTTTPTSNVRISLPRLCYCSENSNIQQLSTCMFYVPYLAHSSSSWGAMLSCCSFPLLMVAADAAVKVVLRAPHQYISHSHSNTHRIVQAQLYTPLSECRCILPSIAAAIVVLVVLVTGW